MFHSLETNDQNTDSNFSSRPAVTPATGLPVSQSEPVRPTSTPCFQLSELNDRNGTILYILFINLLTNDVKNMYP